MSSDFEGYEQDFAVLTAEITSKISRVPRLPPDEKKQMVANVEKQLEEARELLEQMDLEVREIPPQSRGMYSNRMRSYKQEMGKLETDFKRSRIAYSDEVRNELLGDDGNSSENQRAHLLDNTERLERSSRRLEAGYQIAVETVWKSSPQCDIYTESRAASCEEFYRDEQSSSLSWKKEQFCEQEVQVLECAWVLLFRKVKPKPAMPLDTMKTYTRWCQQQPTSVLRICVLPVSSLKCAQNPKQRPGHSELMAKGSWKDGQATQKAKTHLAFLSFK
ncbi:vesicle transport through interaction with t-SNAREs homolog 1A isoform X1 [Cricetulus griseus]|uniref:Vesicle transport through interaction with t-SNAREs homolog 1A isoform X1 n=2 Tax=Cricetidae TaxID=337677 RepID=A0A9J7JKK0_CRIGR|nr:vesicle transport through interaction with t-SNAREs homolog 1A isoform X1 [Cricetulus griseus]XP_027262801.1 vesicle transport through interaction with t-SNAREs homolog 1A isoform X1 [Cricetulus griseus]